MNSCAFLRIAHRGASGFVAENTLEAFEKAIELNADMIEFDVRQSACGNLVVIHDTTLDRTTNGTGLVKDLTLQQIKEYRTENNQTIPLLSEALDCINHRVPINIELKEEGLEDKLIEILHNYIANKGWSYDDFLISSFNHPQLQKIKMLDNQLRLGLLMAGIPVDYAACGTTLGAYSIHCYKEFINQKFINDAHKRGLKFYVFTVNNEQEAENFKKMSVDGIFTDYL